MAKGNDTAKADEFVTVVINVPKVVRKPAKVAMSKDGDAVDITVAIEMEGVTADAILDAAIRTVVINTQGKIRAHLRKEGATVQSIAGRTFPATMMPTRQVADPVVRARQLLANLSPEQKAELLASLA